MVRWYSIYRSATDRWLALDLTIYKSNRQSLQARAVIFVLIYCSENQWYTQEQNRWYSKRTRSFTAVKGLSRHILAPRGAAVFHGPLDGCALLRGVVVPITGNSADREYFRDREASVRRRAAARRGWQRERRWGAAPHPGLSGELPGVDYPQTGLFLKKCLCFLGLNE